MRVTKYPYINIKHFIAMQFVATYHSYVKFQNAEAPPKKKDRQNAEAPPKKKATAKKCKKKWPTNPVIITKDENGKILNYQKTFQAENIKAAKLNFYIKEGNQPNATHQRQFYKICEEYFINMYRENECNKLVFEKNITVLKIKAGKERPNRTVKSTKIWKVFLWYWKIRNRVAMGKAIDAWIEWKKSTPVTIVKENNQLRIEYTENGKNINTPL